MQISPSRRLHGTSARLKRGERGRGSWGSFAWVFEPRSRRYKLVNESSAQCVEIVTGEDKGWKCRRRLLVAAAAAPVVLRVGLAVRPAARLRLAPALRPRGRRTRRGGATPPPEASPIGFPVPTSGGPARRRAPVLEGLTAPRRRAPVVLKARPLRRPIFEAAAARRSSRITKASARRRSIFETTPTGRRARIVEAAALTESAAPSGSIITTKAATAARVAEAAAAHVAVTESAAPGAVVATETAARRRPVVGPGAAAAPVRRPVGGGAALAGLRVGRLRLRGAFGAQTFSFSSMSRDLGRPFLFFFPPLGLLGGAAFGLLSLPSALFFSSEGVGRRLVGALLVLGPGAL